MSDLHSLFVTIEAHQHVNKHHPLHRALPKMDDTMHSIAQLPDGKVPRDGEFRFRERARVLVDLWNGVKTQTVEFDKPGGTTADDPVTTIPTMESQGVEAVAGTLRSKS
jgi:hypothetical protein